jgi:hypothetical protein
MGRLSGRHRQQGWLPQFDRVDPAENWSAVRPPSLASQTPTEDRAEPTPLLLFTTQNNERKLEYRF